MKFEAYFGRKGEGGREAWEERKAQGVGRGQPSGRPGVDRNSAESRFI